MPHLREHPILVFSQLEGAVALHSECALAFDQLVEDAIGFAHLRHFLSLGMLDPLICVLLAHVASELTGFVE